VNTTQQPLTQSLALFRHFAASGVEYCHFKSNEHLLAGLAGATDLDLLVRGQQARTAQGALERAGFKRFDARHAGSRPAVEDYLGFDSGTGRLIHAHVHYALVVGERHLKGFHLDFGGELLATRVPDAGTGVYTSDPSHEMLLLLIRYALKARLRDCLRELLGRRHFGADARAEHAWLLARLDRDRLRRLAAEHFSPGVADLIDGLVERPPSVWRLRALRRRAARVLARQRTYGPMEFVAVRFARELSWWLGGLNQVLLRRPIPFRRVHPAGGRIIALLGPDGSGKSTVAREVQRWLAWKLDVYPVYFGTGDGPSSLLRWPFKLALRLRSPRRPRRSYPLPAEGANGHTAIRISLARLAWALVLAAEKRSKMRAAVTARNRGMIVVCDRYPQAQVTGFNDGPLLASWLTRPGLRGRLARWEYETYARLSRIAPDLVVKLDVTPETGMERSPDTAPGEVERKRAAVRAIDYGPHTRTIEIDSLRPLPEVLLAVKQAVWAQL
jgi:thymidylate kinase